jgi:hypothetical protein
MRSFLFSSFAPPKVRSPQLIRLLLVCLPAAALLPACGLRGDDSFREGVPTSQTVELRVPGSEAGAQSALGTQKGETGVTSALLGDQAEYYVLTRDVTAVINGGTYGVLTLVRAIVGYPATSVTGDTAVWGPHTEPLSPNTWRLTVTRVEPHSYDYRLEARAKQEPDTAFRIILAGHHNAIVGPGGEALEGVGSGTFTADWDAAQTLPQHDKIVGKADFTYARASLAQPVTIDVVFTGIQDDKTGEIFNAVYQYTATPGAGGDFQYAAHQDALPGPGPTGSARELLTVHSRWQETGTGRCDVQITGGDAPATPVVNVNECWDENFLSTFKEVSYDPTKSWGQESTCAFVPAAYSSLN